MKVRLALALLHWFACLLTESKRDAKLPRWISELERSSKPLRYALSILPAAIVIALQTPFVVRPEDVVKVKRGDRIALGLLRMSVVMLGLTAMLLDLIAVASGAMTAPGISNWLIGAHLFVIYAYGVMWHGLGIDWPWLRMTRLGSGLMLSVLVGPITWIETGHALPSPYLQLWLLSAFTTMTWDSYWAVARPLRKRGLLSR